MAIPTWPAGLPELRGLAQSAGSKALHPAVQETQFDDGPPRLRRRQLFVTTPLAMSLRLTADQFVALKAFHLNDLNTGTRRFNAPVLLPDMTIGTRVCTIQGELAWSSLNRFKYLVSFTLVVQDW
ncbi:hypothetical protein [Methylobacterium sp. J-092]|uniref:hypothetical protein n=1 Tax=Methylobacterium sp. J-092 TaxID=2836667 RepID=UPI001FB98DC4|nr:hypothetical protein [Methylobacterium sp. J-092]MCJ2009809.1 hypothetical protein [Methylobacterium sp. J-092]